MPTEEITKILSCIGKEVHYTYPGVEPSQHGILKDRCVFESPYGGTAYPIGMWLILSSLKARRSRNSYELATIESRVES